MEIVLGVSLLFLVLGFAVFGSLVVYACDRMLHSFTKEEIEERQCQNEIFSKLVRRHHG